MAGRFKKSSIKKALLKNAPDARGDYTSLAVPGISHIELTGNREAVIDECAGILEYNSECVRLRAGKMIIKISGSELTISSMNAQQTVVLGNIASLDFSS